MAKTFLKVFLDSMETHYRSGIPYLASAYASGVKLISMPANDGTDNVRYEIQRFKRLTSTPTGVGIRDMDRDGAETATSKFAGNALIARMNKLQQVN